MKQQNSLTARIAKIRERVAESAAVFGRSPDEIQIMAVTKTVPPERVREAWKNGITLFGENRVQEYMDKRDAYGIPDSLFHFIGHLQTNKVKYIIDKVSCIESVSSVKLAEEIERRASALNKRMPVLLEVNIAGEDSKSGFHISEIHEAALRISEFGHLSLSGLMCIPKPGEGDYWFQKTAELFQSLSEHKLPGSDFRFLSMGMSEDYEAAIRNGSNIVRLGRILFGERS